MPEWIGKTIGKVRIERLLARGGMAEVYLGTHLTLERSVAIKLLHSYVEEDPFLLDRFRREAKAVAGLRHPNIVQIFDFDTVDGHPYIVMEYLKGPTLATYLRNLHQRKKRIPSDQVARLLNELSDALDYAHGQGVIHRDIKPGNIMLHNKTDNIPLDKPLTNDVEAVITDFGLVRVINEASQTASGILSGTPAYMSPEQGRGDQVDHRTDIYSLGIVLYEMLAGRVPFEADNTVTILYMHIHTPPPAIPGLPAKIQAVIDRALQKKPDDRYQTSSELAIDYYRAIGLITQDKPRRDSHAADIPAVVEVPVDAPDSGPPVLEPEDLKEEASPPPAPVKQESAPRIVPKKEYVSRTEAAPRPDPKSEPKQKPEPKAEPKRVRGRSGVPLLLFLVLGLLALAVGGYVIISNWRQTPPVSTAPANTQETPNTGTSPSPAPAPALPSPERMVRVPADSYSVGVPQPDQFHVASRSIALESYWIDQYETTNEQYQKYMSETGAAAPIVALDKANFPVRGVNFEQAKAYCQWLKKRLPKEAEWEAAGRGPGENPRIYPTEDPNFSLTLPDALYDVGTLANNVSPFKVYDLVGNVWEWVDEPYDPVPPDKNVLRGGRYSLPQDLAYRLVIAPDNSSVQYAGFRCAASEVSQ